MDGNSDQELNTLAGHEANPRKISGSQSGPELSRGEVTNHVDHMGYDAVRVEESNKQLPEAKKKWADSLNEKINTGKSWSRLSNGANNPKKNWIGIFFAEFEDKKEKKRKKKAKKFGELMKFCFVGGVEIQFVVDYLGGSFDVVCVVFILWCMPLDELEFAAR
ncbi:hypothetical protein V6N11_057657 [Hibiscus sabdariffa]|uniref:Uncharacterized protein n=1 Tax=Hibiscus sabdariffa TaxID=183260 RepID=A0ABR2NI06_9ROSI